MSKKYLDVKYLLCIISIVLVLGFLNIAWAAPPEIDSITPDMGRNNAPTQVIINGSGFQPTPQVALYGGGPHIIGACDTPGMASGVYVAGSYAYVADESSGLQVIDISDPENPDLIGGCGMPAYTRSIYVTDTYAYVADAAPSLQVIDISDPENPSIVGACGMPGSNAYDVYVAGNYAYVANGYSGLYVIDISDPENPSIVGFCDTPGSASDIHVTGTYAYVLDSYSGLTVIDISNSANPSIVGSCDTPDEALDIYVDGTYVYVADRYSGLQVIDIGDPENPTIVGACDTLDAAHDVYVTGTYAYVAGHESDLQVIEKFSPLTDVQYVDSGTLIVTVPAGYRPGTYNLHVTNSDGGHAVIHNAFTSVPEEVEVTMALPGGWSMISLPVRPEVPTVPNLFPEAVVVYKYQQGAGYVRITGGESLEVGMGYWILLNYPRSYLIRGTAITDYTTSVDDGWYMIGGCSSPAQKMVTSGKIDVIYGYTQGKGYIRIPGSQPLERGKGYWILFSDTTEGAEFTASTPTSE